MPIFYFHLCDGGDLLLDSEGRDLDAAAVPASALEEARAIIAADARKGAIRMDQYIEVHDAQGRTVHRVDFRDAVTISPSGPSLGKS